VPLAALHLALVVRVLGDAAHHAGLRMWGGLFNEVAVIGFLMLAAWSVLRDRPIVQPIILSTRAT